MKKNLRTRIIEKCILVMIILCSVFLYSISLASGLVTIDNVDIPTSINEDDTLYVSFSASTDTIDPISYEIYHNGVLVSADTDYTLFINYSMQGNHNFTFIADDTTSTISEEHILNVIDIPLSISMSSPENKTYNTRSISVSVLLNIDVDSCTYFTNNSLTGLLSGSGKNFNNNINFSQDGSYLLTVNCSNSYESKIKTAKFNIDTVNPVIISKSATVNSDGTVTMSAMTDVVCLCKYDLSDKTFDSMIYTFSNTNNLQHYTTISNLIDGSYIYYLKCKSITNNVGNVDTVSFNVVVKPKAAISIDSISSNSPLKVGTYEVRLTASESLISAPSLYYNFNTDTTQRFVTLTGSGTSWHGYIIIDADMANVVGTFYYSGVDLSNNVGTTITSGQLFLVDTTAPVAPISIEAETESDGDIKVKWYYDGEEVEKYNIYRSTSGDPQYVDYFDSTSSKQYIDEDTIDGITYYYKVAAVDDARNDGYLSDIVQATSARRTISYISSEVNQEDNDVPEFLDTALIPKVDQLVKELNDYIIDINILKNDLGAINDPSKLKIINLLKLSEKINDARTGIDSTINQVNDLKNNKLSVSELDVKLNKLRMDGIKYKSMVTEDIIVNEQSSFDQVTQGVDVDNAITEIVDINLSRNILNDYTIKNKQLQDNIVVSTDIIIFKIKYFGKDDYEKYTLVKKVVSSSVDLSNISIIEIIPKSFEQDAKDLIFDIDGQKNPTIVKSDPVLRWDADSFNKKIIYYMINTHAEMSSAKDTKTIVLLRPDFKVSQTIGAGSNSLTGLVSLDFIDFKLSAIHWIILIGIGMIIGLSTYYVSLDKKQKQNFSKNDSDENKIVYVSRGKDISNSSEIKKNSHLNSTHSTIVNFDNNNNNNNNNNNSGADISNLSNAYSSNSSSDGPIFKNNINPSSPSLDDMSRRLDAANLLINSFDYEKSRQIYNSCIEYYKKHHFKTVDEKKEFKAMLDHLYTKLMAYRLVHISRKTPKSSIEKNIIILDSVCLKLYHSINEVAEEYRDDEKRFIDYIYSSNNHLKKLAS